MTPDALRAAIASARKRPRMYGATPMHAAAYLLGMIAGAAPDGAAVNAAWLDAYAAADPLHPTDAEVCDAAEATVAALWPQGDDAPALDLAAIEAREIAALAEVRERLRTWRFAPKDLAVLELTERRAEEALRLVAEVRCLRAAERHSAGPDALDDATAREVLDATRAVVTEGLGLTAAPDVVTLQLPEYVANLLARVKRLERECDAAEAEVRPLRAQMADLDALRDMLWHAVLLHPLPWRIEQDWAWEVIAADGTTVAKCQTPARAQAVVATTEAMMAEMADAGDLLATVPPPRGAPEAAPAARSPCGSRQRAEHHPPGRRAMMTKGVGR